MKRAELFARLAELHEQSAAVCAEIARVEEREARVSPTGWISQRESPIGRRAHLALWRRLRDDGSDGAKAAGKARLIRADIFDASLSSARRPTRREAVRVDLAAAFGVADAFEPGGGS